MKEKLDIYQMITDRVIALLEQGVAPWRKPWSYGGEPLNLSSGKHYQGINSFLLACSGFASNYWVTYKQAQALGGQVMKGEKASPIIFWKLYEKEDEKAEDGKINVPVLRYYSVFNLGQCEGLEIPESEDTWYKHDPIKAAENIIANMPNAPKFERKQNRAFYSPDRDLVNVPEMKRFEKVEEYYSTFFHELAHSTGHKNRLSREGITKSCFFGSHDYSKEELVAEMGAAFLCGHCGIESVTIENSAAYLQSWIKTLRGDKKLAVIAAAQAQKAANYILNKEEEKRTAVSAN